MTVTKQEIMKELAARELARRQSGDALPGFSAPTAETGAYLQDRLVKGFGNFLSLPGAVRDLAFTGAERAMQATGREPASRETVTQGLRKASDLIPGPLGQVLRFTADAPSDVVGELQEAGIDPLTGAQAGNVVERTAGDFLEGATSFPPAAGISGIANMAGKQAGREAKEAGFGPTGQTVAEVGAGVLTGGLTGAIKGLPAAIKTKPVHIMSLDELRTASTAAFNRARQIGADVKPMAMRRLNSLVNRGIPKVNKDLHPQATAALKEVQSRLGRIQTIDDLQELREIVSGAREVAFRAGNAKDGARINHILDAVDDFAENLRPLDLVKGSKEATAALKEGRQIWRRVRKVQQIREAIDLAGIRAGQFSGSGFENALRTQFRQIAMNPKKARGFTKDELAAIKKVAAGTPLADVARFFGKFAPRGILQAMFAGGAAAQGGPLVGVGVLATGEAGRQAATALTKGAARQADEIIRHGGPLPASRLRELSRGIPPGAAVGAVPKGSE